MNVPLLSLYQQEVHLERSIHHYFRWKACQLRESSGIPSTCASCCDDDDESMVIQEENDGALEFTSNVTNNIENGNSTNIKPFDIIQSTTETFDNQASNGNNILLLNTSTSTTNPHIGNKSITDKNKSNHVNQMFLLSKKYTRISNVLAKELQDDSLQINNGKDENDFDNFTNFPEVHRRYIGYCQLYNDFCTLQRNYIEMKNKYDELEKQINSKSSMSLTTQSQKQPIMDHTEPSNQCDSGNSTHVLNDNNAIMGTMVNTNTTRFPDPATIINSTTIPSYFGNIGNGTNEKKRQIEIGTNRPANQTDTFSAGHGIVSSMRTVASPQGILVTFTDPKNSRKQSTHLLQNILELPTTFDERLHLFILSREHVVHPTLRKQLKYWEKVMCSNYQKFLTNHRDPGYGRNQLNPERIHRLKEVGFPWIP